MYISAGRINKLFGTEGGVMMSLYETFPEDFDPSSTPLFVEIEGLDVPLWCDRFERRGTAGAVATFADLDTERRAAEVLGREFRIDLQADDDDEFYLEDLIGFTAVCTESRHTDSPADPEFQQYTGLVTDYIDSDANPLFELEIEGRCVLVPAVEEFIARIDFEERRIGMILPEGLLELE